MKPRFVIGLTILTAISMVSLVFTKDKRGQIEIHYQMQTRSSSTLAEDTILNWPNTFGIQSTDKLSIEISGQGSFWRFTTPIDTPGQYLYGGDIWVGGIVGDDTLVSVGFGGWSFNQEFLPPLDSEYNLTPTVTNPDYISDNTIRAEFTDTVISVWPRPFQQFDPVDGFHRPMNLKVANRSHVWRSSHLNDLIIYDVIITNIGDEPISDCYMAGFFDCDIFAEGYYGYNDDLSGSLKEYGIGYSIDNDGDFNDTLAPYPVPKIFAFKYLNNSFKATDTNFNWWVQNWVDDVDFGPRKRGTSENPFREFETGGTGYPEGDANKYYLMSFDEWDYDQISTYIINGSDPIWMEPPPAYAGDFADGYDTRFLMSLGKFQLPADSSVRILFTTFTGDFVHTTGDALNYLPNFPGIYLSLTYFGDVIANAQVADSLAQELLNPNLPPLGLEVALLQNGTRELQWDPWVYEDVIGYDLYLSEANLDTLPHPGAIPPWWGPDTTQSHIALPRTHKFSLDSLNPDKYYLAAIANRLDKSRGELSAPIQIKFSTRDEAPKIPAKYAFLNNNDLLKLRWIITDKSKYDHFNIYKFSNSPDANQAYHATYDLGFLAQHILPEDSFDSGDKKYFYYEMHPYAVVNGNDSIFYDTNGSEGDVYLIAGSDIHGFETEFTEPIFAHEVDEMTRDVLLITGSGSVTSVNYTYVDSIYSFYNRVLKGLDYEIYFYRDSTHLLNCPDQDKSCFDWRDMMSFKMVIIDDRLSEGVFAIPIDDVADHFVRYISYGGKLALFTRFRNYGLNNSDGFLEYYRIRNKYVNDYLGVDSILFGGEKYYHNFTSPPYEDSLFGFKVAFSVDSSLPEVRMDELRDPFRSRLRNYWTSTTPPGVATFRLTDEAVPIQIFGSTYPDISLQQGHIVGVKREFPELNTSTFVFGYHLWYMDSVDARNLINSILFEEGTVLSSLAEILPLTFSIIQAHSIAPEFAHITLGNVSLNHGVDEIDISSIQINKTVTPTLAEIVQNTPGYAGDALRLEIPLSPLLLSYGPIRDTLKTTFEVSGFLTGGEKIYTRGPIIITGHLRGDFNGDGVINFIDLNVVVAYLFRGLVLSENMLHADIVQDNSINVLDLTRLVNYLFRGGTLD